MKINFTCLLFFTAQLFLPLHSSLIILVMVILPTTRPGSVALQILM